MLLIDIVKDHQFFLSIRYGLFKFPDLIDNERHHTKIQRIGLIPSVR